MFPLSIFLTLATVVLALPFEARDASVGGGLKLGFTVAPGHDVPRNYSRSAVRLQKKDDIPLVLANGGNSYYLDILVGSQKEKLSVVIDTGSSDLWVGGPNSNLQPDQIYDPSQSSTSEIVPQFFSITYGDLSTATGQFFTDNVGLGDITVKSEFAVANYVTGGPPPIFGIGLVGDEADGNVYPNVPVSLVQQGFISANFYTLYLDSPGSNTGEIIFGGTDDSKYTGNLVTLPLQSNSAFFVNVDSVGGFPAGYAVLLDSGTTETYLPKATVDSIGAGLKNAHYDSRVGGYVFPTEDAPTTGNIEYVFGDTTITIPLSSLVGSVESSDPYYADLSVLTIYVSAESPDDDRHPPILGDNFLRWAYVVYDLDNLQVKLAQSKFD